MSRRKPPVKIIVPVLVLLLVGGGLVWWWNARQTAQATDQTLSGTVESTDYQVAATIAGRVTEVTVREGDAVKSGDVVVRLDDTALRLQIDQANEGVNAARANVRQLQNDDATTAEIDAAKAREKQAEAAVRLAEVQAGYAQITAPHDGIVTTLSTNVGQNAGPGRTLLTLVDPADRFVRIYVPEPRLGEVSIRQSVELTSDQDATRYRGEVTWIATDPEFTPNNVQTAEQRVTLVYEVRVRITDAAPALRQGLPVTVTL